MCACLYVCRDNSLITGISAATVRRSNVCFLFCRYTVLCPSPSAPARGKRLGNNFQDGRSVTFECDKGFDLFGSKTIKCIGGLWNANIPDCKGTLKSLEVFGLKIIFSVRRSDADRLKRRLETFLINR